MKINWEAVGKVAKKACGTAGYVLLMAAPYVLDAKRGLREQSDMPANYGGAVRAILNSDMLDCYKREAMSLVTNDLDGDIYEAIIEVAKNDDTLDCYKIDMIRRMVD